MGRNKTEFGSLKDRHFCGILYCKQSTLEVMLLNNFHRISNYAFAFHDKDTYDEDVIRDDVIVHRKGDIKEPHIHLVISFYNQTRHSTVCKMFKTDSNVLFQKCTSRVTQYRYLIHADDKDKYQYDKSIIRTNDVNFWEKLCIHGDKKDNDNVAEKIIDDMLSGVNPYLMVKRYGRDYIIHYRAYKDVVDSIRDYDANHKRDTSLAVSRQPQYDDDQIPFD